MVSERLHRWVRGNFGAGDQERVLERIGRLGLPPAGEAETERRQAAVVLATQGDIGRLDWAAELAETDWRDILMAGGLGHADWPERLDALLGKK